MNSLKLGACALPLFALLLLSGCGVANPVAPTVAAAPSSDNAAYQIGSEDEGLGSGGAVSGAGSGGASGAGETTGGPTPPPPGRRHGHEKHPKPRH